MENYEFDDHVWIRLSELIDVLKPCYDLTKELSRVDILPTDAYLRWMETRFKIKRLQRDGLGTYVQITRCIILFNFYNLFYRNFSLQSNKPTRLLHAKPRT